MPNTELFRSTLSAGIQRIRHLEGKRISVIQDELGYAIGRETGGSAIEHWRKGNIPSDLRELVALAREIVARTDVDSVWVEQLLTAADFPYPEQFATDFFVELGRTSDSIGVLTQEQAQGGSQETIADQPSTPLTALDSLDIHKHFHRFIGRDDIVAQIRLWLQAEDGYSIIGIDGMGGVGKSSLVQAVAMQAIAESSFDAFCWISAGQIAPQHDLPAFQEQSTWHLIGDLTYPALLHSIQHALDSEVPAESTVADQELTIRSLLRHRRLLLVIDNLETAPALQNDLPTRLAMLLGNSRALLTSRIRFQGALHVVHLSGFTEDEALDFLAVESALHLGGDDAAVSIELFVPIAQATGGLPFALKLVVGQLELLSPDEILSELNTLSATAAELVPTGQPTLYAYLFDTAWQHLTNKQRALLATLSLFAPSQGCDFAALHQVSGIDKPLLLPILAALWRASLVEVEGGNRQNLLQKRYRLHPLTHQYIQTQLQGDSSPLLPPQQLPYDRYIAYYSDVVTTYAAHYAHLDGEIDNVSRAMQFAFIQCGCFESENYYSNKEDPATTTRRLEGDIERVVRTIIKLSPFCAARGRYAQATAWLTLVQSAAELRPVADPLRALLPSILLQKAEFAERQGNFAQTTTIAEQALTLAGAADDPHSVPGIVGRLLHCLGRAQTNLGDYERAIQTLERAHQLISQTTLDDESATLQASLGKVQRLRGDYASAEQYLKTGLQLAQQRSNKEAVSLFWMHLGSLAGQLGQFGHADLYLHQGLTIAQTLGLRPRIGRILHLLGGTATMRGEYDKGEELSLAGLEIAREIGDLDMECVLLTNLGVISGSREQYEECRHYGEEALAVARLMDHTERIVGALTNLARLAEFQKNYLQASLYLDEALKLVETLDAPWSQSDVWLGLGRLELAHGRYGAANVWFEKGLALGRTIGIPELEADACYLLAKTAIAQDDRATARRRGEEALQLYRNMQHGDVAEVEHWLAELA